MSDDEVWNFRAKHVGPTHELVADLNIDVMKKKVAEFQRILVSKEEEIMLSHLSILSLEILRNKIDAEIKRRVGSQGAL